MANLITGLRILFSIGLFFCPLPSAAFYVLYLGAGFSDVIDGAVARITHTESEFGSKLDTLADAVFVAVCLVKLLPILHPAAWQYAWIAVIAEIKVVSAVFGLIAQKKSMEVHSAMNKITGGVLFSLPLTLPLIDPVFSVTVVCFVATFAAIEERIILKGKFAKNEFTDRLLA